jgi:hypothetical protein
MHRLRLLLVFLFSSLPVIPTAWAQSAAIVRPSIVSKDSHELSIDPSFAGFRIGENIEKALKKIGKPLVRETLGEANDAPVSYTNKSTGIGIIAARKEGVGVIFVTNRTAGALGGIRIGDSHESVVAKWGVPASGNKRNGLWLAGKYVITITFDEKGRVSRLGIGIGMNIAP